MQICMPTLPVMADAAVLVYTGNLTGAVKVADVSVSVNQALAAVAPNLLAVVLVAVLILPNFSVV